MRRIGPLLMSTILVTGCAGLATKNESLRVLLERSGQSQPKLSAYDQGKRYLQLGSAGLAVDAFQAALKENPDSVGALNGLAVAYDRLGRADVAQRFLDHALTVDPNSAVTLNNLAYLNLVQGNTAVALAYAERAKIAATLPMDMMLPDTIANTVDRTAEIANQLARNEAQERPVAAVPMLPPESAIKRVGLNEWELRIRPPNPADAVRINLPARSVAPRAIEPMARTAVPLSSAPLTEAVVMDDIPVSVVADLLAPPSEPAAASETVVASLPEPTQSEAVAISAPSVEAAPAMSPALAPETAEAATLPVSEPLIRALPESIGPLPESAPDEAMVAHLPAPEPAPAEIVVASLPAPGSVSAPQLAPEEAPASPALTPAAVNSSLKAPVPLPESPTPRTDAVAALAPLDAVAALRQPLPKPAWVEPLIRALPESVGPLPESAPDEVMVVHLLAPEPATAEIVVASLPAPEPAAAPRLAPEAAPASLALTPAAPSKAPVPLLESPTPRADAVAALAPLDAVAALRQPLPKPAWVEPMIAAVPLSSASPAMPSVPALEPAAVEEDNEPTVIASLPAPDPSPPPAIRLPQFAPPDRSGSVAIPETTTTSGSRAPAATAAPAARLVAPMVASLAPRASAPRLPGTSGTKADWKAYVPPTTRFRISNGTGRRLMAGRFAKYLGAHGLSAQRIANANSFDYWRTVIFYNPEQREHAYALAGMLPFPCRLAEASQGRGEIELILGFDLLPLDESLRAS